MGCMVPRSKPKLPGGTRWNATPRAESVAFGPAHVAEAPVGSMTYAEVSPVMLPSLV